MKEKLWVDDLRPPPDDTWEWVTNPWRAIGKIVGKMQCDESKFKVMSLDHDLGGDLTSRPIVLFLCEYDDYWPVEVYVHSQNPVGVSWLTGMIERYKV